MRKRAEIQQEDGAALLILALVLVMLVGIAAIVVDLAALRLDRRVDRLVSDVAATSGAGVLDQLGGGNAQTACETAWSYLLLNLADEGAVITVPNCAQFASACNPSDPHTAFASAGPYNFEIHYPVADDDPLMSGQELNPEIDGDPCQRFGIRIVRQREFSFARVMGIDTGGTDVRSVAKVGTGRGEAQVVPLVVLEPYRCSALYTSGQGKVTVRWYDDATGIDVPGIIVVDSNASDCHPSDPYSIDSQGVQKGWIRALPVPGKDIDGAILSYALGAGGHPATAYDPADPYDPINPADLTDPSEPASTWFRMYPVPTGTDNRITRAPIDWRYNCLPAYPNYFGITIPKCPDSNIRASYVDQLVGNYDGAPGIDSPGPGVFQQWTAEGYSCNLQSSDADIPVSGNWWIDCPGTSGSGGLTVRNNVTFSDGDVVFDGQVRVIGGSLSINDGGADDHIVFIRNGNFIKDAQATVILDKILVYLADPHGAIDFNGGTGGLEWIAPEGPSDLALPTKFEDLALWSEGDTLHRIGGQAGNVLEGTFFTPFADPFVLSGQGSQFQTEAQFVTRRLELSGQAELRMTPNPDRSTPFPVKEIRLIR